MGSVMGDADEQPVRRVYLVAFVIDRYQVSVGQFAKFLEATSQAAPPDWSIKQIPARIVQSSMWIGRMRMPTAHGPASAWRPRQNGRRRRGELMAGPIPGEMSFRQGFVRTRRKRSGVITGS